MAGFWEKIKNLFKCKKKETKPAGGEECKSSKEEAKTETKSEGQK